MRSSTSETRINDTVDIKGKYEKSYFITIRKHQVKDYVDVQDITNIMNIIFAKLSSLRLGSYSYEVDNKYRQLHFHAIVYLNEYLRYRAVSSFGGFRIYWKSVYNNQRLLKYINKGFKNKYQQEQIISDNFYTHPKAPNRFT